MAAILRMRVRSARPPARSRRTGSTCSSNIGCISWGGPGRRTSMRPSASTRWPGAVPRGLRRTAAPSITSACFSLTGAITRPKRANRAFSSSMSAGSRRRGRPSAAAAASRVRSSSVGPRPPVEITISARASALRKADSRSDASSATVTRAPVSMPTSSSFAVRYSAFVSERSGVSSSVPTARISALIIDPPSHNALSNSPPHIGGQGVLWSGR